MISIVLDSYEISSRAALRLVEVDKIISNYPWVAEEYGQIIAELKNAMSLSADHQKLCVDQETYRLIFTRIE